MCEVWSTQGKAREEGVTMGKSICHLEIPTTDLHKAGEFYKKLFGWEIDYSWGPDMAMFKAAKSELSGGGFDRKDKITPGVVIYVEVDDINAAITKAVELGGEKVQGKAEIPRDIGWFGLFKDLDGNTIGLFTPNQ
jgi:predicted enzyme related to lactoylglutathione lyase